MKRKIGTYFLDKEKKLLIFNPPLKKCKNGIRVYFTRCLDEKVAADCPIAHTDAPNANFVTWDFDNFNIIEVMVKRRVLFGIFGYRWELLEEKKP